MIQNIYQKYVDSNQLITTDSRNIPLGSIFFALKGDTFDGNKYASDAINKGAAYAIIDNADYFKDEKTILVDNALETLQQLANHYRNTAAFKVIGLTGTNGKTTTKELIYATLSQKYKCTATQGNLNNHIGVPLTILSAPTDTEILIVEMGANHQGEIADLCKIAEPDFGLITNIGKAHLEGFGGYQGVIKAKSEIYQYLKQHNKTTFVDSTDKLLLSLIDIQPNIHLYGDKNTLCYIEEIVLNESLNLKINIEHASHDFSSQLFGKYNASNILTATFIANFFQVETTDISRAIKEYVPSNNRSQILKTQNNTLILDSYNANPSSMEAALLSFSAMDTENKIIILGEMKELGDESEAEHKKIIQIAQNLNLKEVHLVGFGFIRLGESAFNIHENTQELIKYLETKKINNAVLLIKGSRANKLEQLAPYL